MKKALLPLILTASLISGCSTFRAHTQSEKNWFIGAVAGQTADLATTKHAFDKGLKEGNQFTYGKKPNTESIAIGKLGVLGVIYGLGQIDPDNREIYYKIGSIFGFGAAIWNENQIKMYGR